MRRRVPLRAVVALVAATALACSSGTDDDRAASTTAPPEASASDAVPTTDAPSFRGDPDSAFCRLVAESDERPILDPFEPGLDPDEVELRFLALRNRFVGFAEVAPPEVSDELGDLVDALSSLGAVLEEHDYDFARLGESGADLALFDDPAFGAASDRIDAYTSQVCTGAAERGDS